MVNSTLSMNQCHLYAQKLNNSAALCIEIGHYDRAIFSLTKALRLSRGQTDESMLCGCSCYHCSLEGCINYSENSPQIAKHANGPIGKDMSCGYVYQQPIRVPPQPIQENHNMGRTLFLIVTFNLAMAHHLSAMSTSAAMPTACTLAMEERTPNQAQSCGNKIKKALQLYEVCHTWYTRMTSRPTRHDCNTSHPTGVSSIRFRMILSNNMSHIHRLGSNCAKQRQCLEHLLSAVMVAVEYKTRTSNHNNTAANPEPSHNGDLCTTNLEGFLMNASRLFLQENCAEAA